MSEVESVDEGIDSDDLFEYSAWAMNKGIWDGRDVTYKDALNLSRKAFLALMNDLFAEESSLIQFQKMAAELAWIGTCSENRHLLDKDIQELNAFSDNFIIKTGFCDSARNFGKSIRKKF